MPLITVTASDTRCLTAEDIQRIETTEIWIWRRMRKQTGPTVYLTKSERKWQLVNLIRERQARWIGLEMHGDTLLKDILQGRIKGKQ